MMLLRRSMMIPAVVPTGLPDDYLQVEYLESTGTQYFWTNIDIQDGLTVESRQELKQGNDSYLFGGAVDSNTNRSCFNGFYSKSVQGAYPGPYYNQILPDGEYGNVYTIKTTHENGVIYIYSDGTLFKTIERGGSVVGNGAKCICFGAKSSTGDTALTNNLFKGKVYSIKVSKGNTMLGDFVPCIRKSDSKPGMYDLVGRTFYTNAGTGEFVPGDPVLPSGYTPVAYLESTGTQYIDSGIECTGDLAVDFSCLFTTSVNAALCGGINSSTSIIFRHHCSPDVKTVYWIQNTYSSSPASVNLSGNVSTNTVYNITIDPTQGTAKVNNSDITFTAVSSSLTTGRSYGIFARINQNGEIQSRPARIYYFKFYRNGALIGYFVPCTRNSDSEPGMYDKVTDTFFTNAGTGDFAIPT